MPQHMGIADINFNDKIFLRKYRWIMKFVTVSGGEAPDGANSVLGSESLIYMANRPKLSTRDEVINHEQETLAFPVRATWEPLDVTFLHVAGDSSLYKYLRKVSDPETGEFGWYQDILLDAVLTMFDGMGNTWEQWWIMSCWPLNIDFGDLDRSGSEIADVKVSFRIARARQTVAGGAPTS